MATGEDVIPVMRAFSRLAETAAALAAAEAAKSGLARAWRPGNKEGGG